jgi:UPF0716 protein FxsA
MPLVLLALLVLPIAEIAVFIQVGDLIGLWPTVLGVVLTAFLGAAILRRQGMRTLQDSQNALRRDESPVRQLFHGFCLFLAGALLLVPGFITDAIGLLLLIPPVRDVLGRWLWEVLRRNASVTVSMQGVRSGGPRRGSTIIEGEYREVDPAPAEPEILPPGPNHRPTGREP